MGSTGKSKSITYKDSADFNDDYNSSLNWFKDNSNIVDWSQDTPMKEINAVIYYTGSGYSTINYVQYNTPWEDMGNVDKTDIANLHNALSKSELYEGVIVNRNSDFQIFGADKGSSMSVDDVRNFLSPTNGVVQNDGFMSFSTDRGGHGIAGTGLITRLHIPPSTGAGAFVAHISKHKLENEFLLNNNAILRYDLNSIRQEGGHIYVDAYWLGQNRAQTISPTYRGNR